MKNPNVTAKTRIEQALLLRIRFKLLMLERNIKSPRLLSGLESAVEAFNAQVNLTGPSRWLATFTHEPQLFAGHWWYIEGEYGRYRLCLGKAPKVIEAKTTNTIAAA